MKKTGMLLVVVLAVLACAQLMIKLPPIEKPTNPWETPNPPTP